MCELIGRHALRPRPGRGFVAPLVLVGLFICIMLVMALNSQMRSGIKQVQLIHDDTQHLYYSEMVFSLLTNRLKKSGWNQRFYYDVNVTPCSRYGQGSLPGGVDYEFQVQDVLDDNHAVRRDLTDVFVKVLYADATQNFFERVKFRDTSRLRPTAARVERFARTGRAVDLRDPTELQRLLAGIDGDERSLLANLPVSRVMGRIVRDLAARRVPAHALLARLRELRRGPPRQVAALAPRGLGPARRVAAGRGAPGPAVAAAGWTGLVSGLLRSLSAEARAGIGSDERAMEADRPASLVRGREVRAVGTRTPPGLPLQVLAVQAQPSLASDIVAEAEILELVSAGETALASAPAEPALARAKFEQAAARAATQSDIQKSETLPRAWFKVAKALTVQADSLTTGTAPNPAEPSADDLRLLSCDSVVAPAAGASPAIRARLAHLGRAAGLYRQLVTDYPDSRDAAHSYIPWGWLAVRAVVGIGVDPGNPAAPLSVPPAVWNQARDCAYARFEKLRELDRYRQYHLWGEDAVTTTLAPGAALPAHDPATDEIVFFERELIGPRVAFIEGDQLMVAALDGTERKMVARLPLGSRSGLNWTRDATAVALAISGSGSDLYVVELGSGTLQRLTANGAASGVHNSDPLFTPDGKHVVFLSDREPPDDEYYVMARDGSELRRLTHLALEKRSGKLTPDGEVLFFAAYSNQVPDDPGQIYRQSLAGGSAQQFLVTTESVRGLAISADGSQLCFSTQHNVYVCATDGSGLRLLAVFPERAPGKLDWTADGTRICASLNLDTGKHVLTAQLTGQGQTTQMVLLNQYEGHLLTLDVATGQIQGEFVYPSTHGMPVGAIGSTTFAISPISF